MIGVARESAQPHGDEEKSSIHLDKKINNHRHIHGLPWLSPCLSSKTMTVGPYGEALVHLGTPPCVDSFLGLSRKPSFRRDLLPVNCRVCVCVYVQFEQDEGGVCVKRLKLLAMEEDQPTLLFCKLFLQAPKLWRLSLKQDLQACPLKEACGPPFWASASSREREEGEREPHRWCAPLLPFFCMPSGLLPCYS